MIVIILWFNLYLFIHLELSFYIRIISIFILRTLIYLIMVFIQICLYGYGIWGLAHHHHHIFIPNDSFIIRIDCRIINWVIVILNILSFQLFKKTSLNKNEFDNKLFIFVVSSSVKAQSFWKDAFCPSSLIKFNTLRFRDISVSKVSLYIHSSVELVKCKKSIQPGP